MKFRVNTAIVGSTGYTGIELIRLLNFHKKAEIKYLISETKYGKNISAVSLLESNPELRGPKSFSESKMLSEKIKSRSN